MMKRRADGPHRESFVSHLLGAAPVVVIVTALTAYADFQWHLFDSFHVLALDVFAASAAPESRDVLLVTITDDDYRTTFDNRSPLNAAELQKIVQAVVDKGPPVIGVDISTAEDDDARLRDAFARAPVPIVWVRDAFAAESSTSRTATWELARVLGSDGVPPGARVGLSLFPREADQIVRGYYRRVPLKTSAGEIASASLGWTVVETYCEVASRDGCDSVRRRESRIEARPGADDSLRFNFAGERYSFRKVPAGALAQAPRGLFGSAIVLIGGTFAASRDFYPTPLGQLSGVELTAMAIESELHGGGISGVNEALMIAMDLTAGLLLIWMTWRWSPGSRTAVLATGMAIVVLAILSSYVAFRGGGYWASFVPVGIGVWLHASYHRARNTDAIRRELEECRKRHARV